MTKPLSPRMEEVVRLVVEKDLSYPETADEMGISVHTVRKYAREIGRRLGSTPQKAMIRYYLEEIQGVA